MDIIFRILREFESTSNPNTFKLIFGHLGPHLWNKFTFKHGSNIVAFSRELDIENNKKLMAYLSEPIQKQNKMVEFSEI